MSMEDDGHGNVEFEGAEPRSVSRKSATKSDFIKFLVIFGWEGPLALFQGFREEDLGWIVGGILTTAFCWGVVGYVMGFWDRNSWKG